MDMFGSSESMGRIAIERSNNNSNDISDLEERIQKLEEYLDLEWSRSNQKYYKVA